MTTPTHVRSSNLLRAATTFLGCLALACVAMLATACGRDDAGRAPAVSQAPATAAKADGASPAATGVGADPATSTRGAGSSITPPPSPTAAAAAEPAAARDFGELYAVFEGMSGRIRVKLHVREAPRACANFVNLVQRGYYVGRAWDDFSPVVRQLGPAASVAQLPYQLPREPSPKLLFDVGGRLAAANASTEPGSRVHPVRIFLTTKPQERWNLQYVVFGTVVEGLDVVQKLVVTEPVARLTIEGDPSALLAAYAPQVAEWNRLLDEKPISEPAPR